MISTSFNRLAAEFAVAISLALAVPSAVHAATFPPLNTPATTQHFPGKFVWADLFTNEPDLESTFYCGLFGWTAVAVEHKEKSYIILSNGSQPVAGIVLRSASRAKRPGVWIGYISVTDAEATFAAMKSAGGQEHAPVRNFPHRGWQAIFSDSEGSPVGILQSSSGDPTDDEPAAGEWNWFELFSLKPHAAAKFYRDTFGFEAKTDTRDGKSDHLVLSSGGHARAGVAPLPASADSRPGWLGTIRVTDIDATAAKATALGGTVVVAPRPAALGSRFAIISDPTGGAVGLVQYIDDANPGNHP